MDTLLPIPMLTIAKNLYDYRELMATLAWKNVTLRYKQAYLGIAWAILKPVMLMLIFTLVKSFVGIDSGDIPYPILVFAALMPWTFFQESTSEGVTSVVGNTALIKKIYFPREIFPITSVLTKLVELGISFVILAGLMVWYQMMPTIYILWVPLIIAYTILAALTIAFVGAAINVYYRDVGQALPVLLSLLMYASPVIYPLQLVKDKLLTQQAAGEWSNALYPVHPQPPGRHHRRLPERRPARRAAGPERHDPRRHHDRHPAAAELPLLQARRKLFRRRHLSQKPMPVIEVSHLTKEYRLGALQGLKQTLLNTGARLMGKKFPERPLFKALDDVSFSIEQGEVVGIIGHNGAGKSTLLKMLARISTPTSGSVKVNGRIAPLIEVGAGFVPDFTGRENVYLNGAILGMSKKGNRQEVRRDRRLRRDGGIHRHPGQALQLGHAGQAGICRGHQHRIGNPDRG
jgi:lipopolysaccharide transport system permease protein